MTFVKALTCRECGKPYPKLALHVCEDCFGPLEVDYDYEGIRGVLTRDEIARRPTSMWRYAELLPLDAPATVGTQVGWTPLVPAPRLARALGVATCWVKNDAVSFPSLSFKDRVVAVAMSKAVELGIKTVACASTGNLANSVGANAAAAGLEAVILIPHDLEATKVLATQIYGARVVAIRGTYDDVNRLCSEISGSRGWGFVNVNLRPFYSEGSKSYAFEIAEQLGWRAPDHIVAPMAGGSLVTKIRKAFVEMHKLGLLDGKHPAVHGAQASGCGPIVEAVRAGRDVLRPVKKPDTIAKSLAIGDPADGYYAIKAINESGGWAAHATDTEIVQGMRLLAETEGIFTETAGGVTIAATRHLIAEGRIKPADSVVVSVTGQGLKTTDPLVSVLPPPPVIGARLAEFNELISSSS
jgi:threonine synthase